MQFIELLLITFSKFYSKSNLIKFDMILLTLFLSVSKINKLILNFLNGHHHLVVYDNIKGNLGKYFVAIMNKKKKYKYWQDQLIQAINILNIGYEVHG